MRIFLWGSSGGDEKTRSGFGERSERRRRRSLGTKSAAMSNPVEASIKTPAFYAGVLFIFSKILANLYKRGSFLVYHSFPRGSKP